LVVSFLVPIFANQGLIYFDMKIKRKILFFIDKEGNKNKGYNIDGKLRLRIRYAQNIVVNFNVGYRAEIAKWSIETQRCKTGTTHGKRKHTAYDINNEIQRLENIAETLFKEYEFKEIVPSAEEFIEAFNTATGKEQKTNSGTGFFSVFDMFVKECGSQNNWTKATFEKFAAIKNHLISFDNNISFKLLNDNKLNDYVNYLRYVKNMRNSTIGKLTSFLKWFLRWSHKKGYNDNTAFMTFNPKLKNTPKKVIFLTWDELITLRKFQIPSEKQYLERVRDVFLFCCFTGLRYSDVYNLKKSNIKSDRIEITTVKTNDSLVIELNNYSMEILEKYSNLNYTNDKALPVITNQKMNEYLKELAELAGIIEPVSETYYRGNERIDTVTPKYKLLGTHAGRRTFICNAIALGIPVQVVMKWSGHSDYKSMKPYIDVADTIKKAEMEKFNLKSLS